MNASRLALALGMALLDGTDENKNRNKNKHNKNLIIDPSKLVNLTAKVDDIDDGDKGSESESESQMFGHRGTIDIQYL